MSDGKRDYWAESMAIAAEECGLVLTPEQLEYLAGAAESSHEHYGMAFYSPPASDRIAQLQREFDKRADDLRKQADAEMAIARRLDEDRQRTIRRQAWRIEELLEADRAR